MAITQNTYTGDGTTVLFTISFPYLEQEHVKATLNETPTTAFTFANSNTLQFNVAPANGVTILLFRETDSAALQNQFFPNSSIPSSSLNNNFTQGLYVAQETENTSNQAFADAATAVTTANAAVVTANAADAKSDQAIIDSAAAVVTANTAESNSLAAVSTANSASSAAAAAVITANAADSTANLALSTAQSAESDATNAVSFATQALNIVAGTIQFTAIPDIASIPPTPDDLDGVQIIDSTGIEIFTPLSGLPGGFVGSPQLFVQLQYDGPGLTWEFAGYGANDPDFRYLKREGGNMTGALVMENQQQARFREASINGTNFVALQAPASVSSDKTITLPDVTGTVITTGDTGTVTSTIIADGTIVNGDISATAAIDKTKISGTAITAADTGTVTSTMILDGTIVDGDVNASAAIAGTKISPDFGSQNVTSTGTSTAASFIPTGSSVPTNGVYLPAANNVAISTNGTGRLFIDASGNVGLGVAPKTWGGGAIGALFNGSGSITAFSDEVSYGNNVYFNGAWRYARSDTAQLLQLGSGGTPLIFYSAASGTADASITWSERFRIDSSGRLGIGTNAPGHELDVNGLVRSFVSGGSTRFISFDGTVEARFGTFTTPLAYVGSQSNHPFAFYTNGSEKARLDTSGRFLVGTSSAVTGGTAQFSRITALGNSAGATNPGVISVGIGTTPSSGNFIGRIFFVDNAAGEYAEISAQCDGTPGSGDYPGRLVFSTTADGASSPTIRFRIGSDGKAVFENGGILIGSTAISSGAGNSTLKYNTATGVVSYDTSSRLVKDNIVDCPYGLDAVKLLQPRKYFRTDDQRDEIGFVADELVNVLPEFVPIGPKSVITKNEQDTEEIPLGVNYEKLTAVLTKALQESIERIETLEAKVAALEAS